MITRRFWPALLGLAFLLAYSAPGAEKGPAKQSPKPKESAAAKKPKEKLSVTHHSVQIGGKTYKYTATAGTLLLKSDDGKPRASVFFIAYTLDGVADASRRPIAFAFNGGPGSSSVWLHLGALGPRRVLLNKDGSAPAPPYRLVNNDNSLLDKSDLVFIDPVSTGFSRAAPGQNPQQFHGVEEDIHSVGDFIELYTTRYARWASPKFLIGESYGTTRAAGLSGYLQDRYGMYLNGIALVSSVLNFGTISFSPGNDLPYILFLPSYTATAWYHHKLSDSLEQHLVPTVKKAVHFALHDYALALMQGDHLSPAKRKAIIKDLSRFTGLSQDYIDRSNLKVPMGRFAKELLRDQRRTVGRYDSRFLGIDRDAAGGSFEYDPSYAAVQGAFTGAMNEYLRADLKYKSDLPYEILTGKVHPWKWDQYQNRYVDVAGTLRSAITQNPHLKVFVACGFYDLATPFLSAIYTFDHLGLAPSLRKNVTLKFYRSGHMVYINRPSLKKLKKDLSHFIRAAVPKPSK